MLEERADESQSLTEALAEVHCKIAVPRNLERIFRRRGPMTPVSEDRRRRLRYFFPSQTILEPESLLSDGLSDDRLHRVYTLNLSRTGIGFLHCRQLFPGDLVRLWTPIGKRPCRIVRCRRHNERCFEIGAAFV